MNRTKIRPEGCARTGWTNPGMGKIPGSDGRDIVLLSRRSSQKRDDRVLSNRKKTCPVNPSQALFRGLEVRLAPLFVWRLNKRAQEGRNRGKSSKDTYQMWRGDPPRLAGRVGRRVGNIFHFLRPTRIGHSSSESGNRSRKRGAREILKRKTAAKHTIFNIHISNYNLPKYIRFRTYENVATQTTFIVEA